MESKIIYKVKKKDEEKIEISTKYCKIEVDTYDNLRKVLNMIGSKWATPNKIENLYKLVMQGFNVKLYEAENNYNLIVYKNRSSINFTSSKEQGTAIVLIQAEDWAEEMLKELDQGHNI